MKLAKTSIVTFGIGGAVILAATLGISYIRQTQDQEQMRQDLAKATARIAQLAAPASNDGLVSQQKQLDSSLAKAQSDYDSVKAKLRRQLDSIEMTDQVSKVAKDSGVRMVGVDSTGLNPQKLNGVSFSFLSLTVTAEGDVPSLVKFQAQVSAQSPTAFIESSQISVPAQDANSIEVKLPSVVFVLTVYSYEDE